MKEIYENGTYREYNPSWHEEHSPWKAKQIIKIMDKNRLNPTRICEIGCGSGEILNQLSKTLDDGKEYFGYEISPQAFELCRKKSKDNLAYFFKDLLEENHMQFDVVMALDVIEHVEDYIGFLKKLKGKGDYKIFHIPLDLSVQAVLRPSRILKWRRSIGHIHYFTKETAIETLKDAGYEIIDYFYTAVYRQLSSRGWKTRLLNILRKSVFPINSDLTVRIFGSYSLLLLTK